MATTWPSACQWAKHFSIFRLEYDRWKDYIGAQWPGRQKDGCAWIGHDDVKFVDKKLEDPVVHCRSHAASSMRVFCPCLHWRWQVLKTMFRGQKSTAASTSHRRRPPNTSANLCDSHGSRSTSGAWPDFQHPEEESVLDYKSTFFTLCEMQFQPRFSTYINNPFGRYPYLKHSCRFDHTYSNYRMTSTGAFSIRIPPASSRPYLPQEPSPPSPAYLLITDSSIRSFMTAPPSPST